MKMTQVKMDPLKSQEMEMTWEVEMEAPMLREFGLQTLNKVSKKLLPFILPVEEGRLFCQTKGRCMVSGWQQHTFVFTELSYCVDIV